MPVSDLTIIRVDIGTAFADREFPIGRASMAIGRFDGPFLIRFNDVTSYQATVDRPFSIEVCGSIIDRVFITVTAPVAGGVVELWCTDGSQVVSPP